MLLALVLSLVLMPCHAMRCPTMPGDHTVRTGRAAHAGSEQTAWGPAGLHFFLSAGLTIYYLLYLLTTCVCDRWCQYLSVSDQSFRGRNPLDARTKPRMRQVVIETGGAEPSLRALRHGTRLNMEEEEVPEPEAGSA